MSKLLALTLLIISFFLPIYGFHVFCKIIFPQDLTLATGNSVDLIETNRVYAGFAILIAILFFYFVFLLKFTKNSNLFRYKFLTLLIFIISYIISCLYISEIYYSFYEESLSWKKVFMF